MDFVSFLDALKRGRMALFTLRDVEALFPKSTSESIKNNLSNWAAKGYITRLRRSVYECTRMMDSSVPEYYVANRLYQPSYVSLEAALSFYGVIPEEAAEVTSVSTKPTRTFRNKYGVFTYRTCKKNAFLGYRIMNIGGYRTLVADREKALADFIYFRLLDGQRDFSEERFNLSKVRRKRALEYARLFNEKTLETLKELL